MIIILLIIYLVLEILNFIYYYHVKKQALKKTYYYGNRIEKSLIKHFLKDMMKFFNSYFISNNKNKFLDINQLSLIPIIRSLLSFFFNKSLSQANYKNLKVVYYCAFKFKKQMNIKFKKINDNKQDLFLRFGKSSITTYYKPLIITILFILTRIYSEFILRKNNFKSYYSPLTNINYWYKLKEKSETPVIFFHGFGIGIIPYINYLIKLAENTSVICPVLPNISNVYFHPIKWNICRNDVFPDLNLLYDELNNILINHKLVKVNIIAHSFGTFILSGIILNSSLRRKIHKKIFIDPVCFHSGAIKVYKSVDRMKKNKSNSFKSIILHYLIYYVIYLDIYLKYATKRNLFSLDYLWGNYRYVDKNTKIVLSENDDITPSFKILEDMKIASKHRNIVWLEDAYHGDLFMTNNWNFILNQLNNFILD